MRCTGQLYGKGQGASFPSWHAPVSQGGHALNSLEALPHLSFGALWQLCYRHVIMWQSVQYSPPLPPTPGEKGRVVEIQPPLQGLSSYVEVNSFPKSQHDKKKILYQSHCMFTKLLLRGMKTKYIYISCYKSQQHR